MKTLLLLCSSGASASVLTHKLELLVKSKLENYQLIPCPITEVANYSKEATMLILTPQVRFNYTKIQQMYPDKTVLKIDIDDFNQLNIEQIYNMIETNL